MNVESSPIRVAVVPAAGDGTRLRPASQAIPKEMLPVPDQGTWKPVIQVVLEEINNSGIREAVVVTKPGKDAIKRHFIDPDEGRIRNIGEGSVHIQQLRFMDQVSGQYGNAMPLLTAEEYLQDENHLLYIWGDEFFATNDKPRARQMIDLFEKQGEKVGVISAVRIQRKADLALYGIADVTEETPGVYRINDMVEKPHPDHAPSNLATHGAYLLPTEAVDILRNQKPDARGEVGIVDTIRTLIKGGYSIFACEIPGADYCDAGTPANYFNTIMKRGLADPVLGSKYRESIINALGLTS